MTLPWTVIIVVPIIVVIAMAGVRGAVIIVIAQTIQQAPNTIAGALAIPVAPEEIEEVVEHGVILLAARTQKNPGRILMDEPGSGLARIMLASGAGADIRT